MTNAPIVTARHVKTERLSTYARFVGPEEGWPVVFIHGNCSDSRFWLETLAALPGSFRGVALDLRGFGDTEAVGINATRGMRDFADDLDALIEHPEVFGSGAQQGRKVLLVAHSAGAGVAMQYSIEHPTRVAGLILESPMSPYGFGGTRGPDGAPCWPDYAGSGGGTANPDFAKRLAAKDRTDEAQTSPRRVLNECYVKPPFHAANEEVLLDSVLSTRVGDGFYPGDLQTSPHWPGIAPGNAGMNNAIGPKHLKLEAFIDVPSHPPVLWIRGADDLIVSDTSLFDFGYLGQLGVVPGWPGAEVYPPQPMVSQMRAVLDRYVAKGGAYQEEVFASCGHSPHIEKAEAFHALAFPFLARHAQ